MHTKYALVIFVLYFSLCHWLMPPKIFGQTSSENGLQWLTSVQQTDGSWGDWSSPQMRNTTSAAETFQELDPTSPSYAAALQWLATVASGTANNDNVSRKITVFSKTTNDINADLDYLLTGRKSDGGWGLESDAESGVLNTALTGVGDVVAPVAMQLIVTRTITDASSLILQRRSKYETDRHCITR